MIGEKEVNSICGSYVSTISTGNSRILSKVWKDHNWYLQVKSKQDSDGMFGEFITEYRMYGDSEEQEELERAYDFYMRRQKNNNWLFYPLSDAPEDSSLSDALALRDWLTGNNF